MPPAAPEDAATLAPEEALAAGPEAIHVPGYEVIQELGRGGMGVVYQAREVELDRLVALKMVLAGAYAGEAERARFHTEAEAVARLQHPHIVQIYAIGACQGLPYFALEFCGGGSLAQKLDGTPWPPAKAASLLEQLARAVHAAHQRHIIHRDLKPANVLLTSDGTPKVTDFGLAKKLDAAEGPTRSGAIMGTPAYMAPEQAGGQSKAIGPAADVYALGAILYELLTGRPPFRAATDLDTILQVVSDEPVPPTRLVRTVPRDLETICLKCLQKEPAKRYATAADLAEDVRRFSAGEPIAARPVGPVGRLLRWRRRNPVVAGLAEVIGFLLLVGLGGITWAYGMVLAERNLAHQAERIALNHAEEARRQRDVAERNLYFADIHLADQAWESGDVGLVEEILRRHTPRETANVRGWEWGYLQALCRQTRVLRGSPNPIDAVSWSPDGKRLATSAWGTLKLWDAATGQEIQTLNGSRVSWSPNGKWLAVERGRYDVHLIDAATGRHVREFGSRHGHWITHLRWSPDSGRVATASYDGTSKVWDAATGREITTFRGHLDRVGDVSWNPDGKRLASGSTDGRVKIWEAATGKILSVPQPGGWQVYAIAWDPDGRRLVWGGFTGELKVWDVQAGALLHTLKGHKADIAQIAWSPDGRRIASASSDGAAILWDAATGQPARTLRGHTAGLSALSWSRDGRHLATGSMDRTARIWTLGDGPATRTLRGHQGEVRAVDWSPDGRRLISTSFDESLRVWDVATGENYRTIRRPVEKAAWSPDGREFAATHPNAILIRDAATGERRALLDGHRGVVLAARWSPDGNALASAGSDRTVRVWDAASGREIVSLTAHAGWIESVSWSPDGRRLASAGQDGTVKVWKAFEKEQRPIVLTGHQGIVFAAEWSPDGDLLASAGADGTVRLWETATFRAMQVLRGHSGAVCSICWSPDGRRLASGSADGTIKIWDRDSGQEALSLRGHAARVWFVAWSRDGTRLASASGDGTVRIWDATPGK
jgi:WD40 repeat protein